MGDPKMPLEFYQPFSANEPPGSNVLDQPDPPEIEPPAAQSLPPLPSDSELAAMTRAELDALADERGHDSTGLATKADVITFLKANV